MLTADSVVGHAFFTTQTIRKETVHRHTGIISNPVYCPRKSTARLHPADGRGGERTNSQNSKLATIGDVKQVRSAKRYIFRPGGPGGAGVMRTNSEVYIVDDILPDPLVHSSFRPEHSTPNVTRV